MERIVYLLGAGFSAPLGLPVMSNFRSKSLDMYNSNPAEYAHFKVVFDTIREMSIIKNYYEANLFNIEEILSILEMGEFLEGKRLEDVFIQYIKDVIAFYTPEMKSYEAGRIPGNWADWLFGPSNIWKPYGMFIGSVLNLSFRTGSFGFDGSYENIVCEVQTHPATNYSIVTLNYDLIPETICAYVKRYAIPSGGARPLTFDGKLAKLHGSIDTSILVPPTWNKGVTQDIVPTWKLAHEILANATQLRIIGYSLAQADAYVRYLLKSATMKESHLRRIDVICRDADGSAKVRYDEFINTKFGDYRFAAAEVETYLSRHVNAYESVGPGVRSLDKLESAHNDFMSNPRAVKYPGLA